MRGTRWLLLVAIIGIVLGVGFTYRYQKRLIREHAPPPPAALPDNLNSTAQNWTYTETNANHTTIEISASEATEAKDSSRVDLKNLVLKTHNKNGETYSLIKSAQATLFKNDHRFYSEGEVEITLNIPEKGDPKHMPVSIKSSGVTFSMDTEKVETDRPSSFVFERGQGQGTGAFYDPSSKELHVKSDVRLDWKSRGPHPKAMRIDAASLEYHEAIAQIWLKPWGKLTRENTVVEGQDAVIQLQTDDEGRKSIRKVQAVKAHGTDVYPNRRLQYAADELWMDFDEEGKVEKIIGQTNAQLVSASDSAETSINAYHVEMNFEKKDEDSILSNVSTSGNSKVTSRPLPGPNRQLTETHVLSSDKLEMKMRPGGREIESVRADAPGTLEFLPNQPIQRHRTLTGRDMFIAYGAQNRIQSFRAKDVHTTTDPNPEEVTRKVPVSRTASADMIAAFDPKTNRMSTMEQTGSFTYEQGDRRARADKASLDEDQNVIVLDKGARMWDATESVSADRIRLDERTGNFTADGHINSSRLPDKDPKKNSEMLSGSDPLQAQANHMVSADRNRIVHYDGDVLMWQGANRISAEQVDLDRDKRTLIADGRVFTSLWEEPKDDAAKKKKAAAPVLTEVKSQHLVYTETNRLAQYTGGVSLKRPNLLVTGREIQAYLSNEGGDSKLEKAYADGDVKIVSDSPGLTRTGTAGHSEFYMTDQKIVLLQNMPRLVDTKGTDIVGPLGLTYFINDDRLLINGSDAQPASSRIKGKVTAKKK